MARARTETNRTPAILASGLLHGLALAAALIAWPHKDRPVDLGTAVPVNIVTQGPVANIRPAEQGVEDVEALTEDPVPEAPPEPAPPTPAPAPTPPTPAAKPAPTPKASAVPTKPAAKPAPAFDLDALAATVAKRAAAGGARSNAARGPARQETAVQARPAVGAANAMVGSALGVLAAELQRRWNPNCEVEGGSSVDIRVGFRLIQGGRIVGDVESSGATASDPVVKAASDRAVRAVRAAAPFDSLPPELFGQKIVVNFNAQKACAGL